MGAAALALGGASVASGLIGAKSAQKGAKAQARAMDRATALQRQMWETGREDLAPWREAGGEAVDMLRGAYGLGGKFDGKAFEQFTSTPGYAFQLEEANKAANRAAAARGTYGGGAQMKRLQEIAQGHAASQYGDYLSGLMGISEAGRGAGSQMASQAQTYGQQMAQNAIMSGQIQADKQAAYGNILGGIIGQGAQIYGMSQSGMFSPPPSFGGYGGTSIPPSYFTEGGGMSIFN